LIGYVKAPDAEQAIEKAIASFGITNPSQRGTASCTARQRDRLAPETIEARAPWPPVSVNLDRNRTRRGSDPSDVGLGEDIKSSAAAPASRPYRLARYSEVTGDCATPNYTINYAPEPALREEMLCPLKYKSEGIGDSVKTLVLDPSAVSLTTARK
jgi:hypothetical protein